ncbi:hypothetical protein VitviT2T_025603 [Vitis vinifera]|uniref:HD-ZIP protein N-terminal domain-containing protein n=1 Tax=Vitis vinifera TaxID=29760 RepID=A0ABY9DL94_VITVI|nr:hypothetical protein VitviT2T_025603 [Vitis vinifera]
MGLKWAVFWAADGMVYGDGLWRKTQNRGRKLNKGRRRKKERGDPSAWGGVRQGRRNAAISLRISTGEESFKKTFRFPWLADNLMSEHSSSDGSERARNVNWFPVAVAAAKDADDEGVLSSPNSTVSFFQIVLEILMQ